jgi:hypothetical protein
LKQEPLSFLIRQYINAIVTGRITKIRIIAAVGVIDALIGSASSMILVPLCNKSEGARVGTDDGCATDGSTISFCPFAITSQSAPTTLGGMRVLQRKLEKGFPLQSAVVYPITKDYLSKNP